MATPSMVLVAVALWCAHYANRAVWYPLTRHMSHTTMPVVASAVAFNLVNGTLMGRELARRTCEPFTAANVPGLCVMLLGAVINVSADAALLRLRAARGGGGGKGRKGGGASEEYTQGAHRWSLRRRDGAALPRRVRGMERVRGDDRHRRGMGVRVLDLRQLIPTGGRVQAVVQGEVRGQIRNSTSHVLMKS